MCKPEYNTHMPAANRSVIPSTVSSVQFLPAHSGRKGFIVHNNSTSNLYLALGNPSSSADFTILLLPQDVYESKIRFTGAVHGVWASANGQAQITDFIT